VPNYIDIAFQAAAAARGANSSVKLFYNDYSAEPMNAKSDKVYNLVKGMKERGIPIDGVGLQFHISVDGHPPLEEIAENMARLGKLGLEVHITEMDLKCPQGCTPIFSRYAWRRRHARCSRLGASLTRTPGLAPTNALFRLTSSTRQNQPLMQ
jgi:GH35 family endo-1,4-beta-xylanase